MEADIMTNNLKIIRDTTREINNQLQDLFQHTKPSVKFYFEAIGRETVFNDNYLITICYQIPTNYGIPTEILANLDPDEFTFDNYITILKELFSKWRFPIAARSFNHNEMKLLKSNFNDAVKFEEE